MYRLCGKISSILIILTLILSMMPLTSFSAVSGCTNPAAVNYDPMATVDDGSCMIFGCTNPAASNYDPAANLDDGSCIISGCTDPLAVNFDPAKTSDDGSCTYGKFPWKIFLPAIMHKAQQKGQP